VILKNLTLNYLVINKASSDLASPAAFVAHTLCQLLPLAAFSSSALSAVFLVCSLLF
jgi:hypothetical protein